MPPPEATHSVALLKTAGFAAPLEATNFNGLQDVVGPAATCPAAPLKADGSAGSLEISGSMMVMVPLDTVVVALPRILGSMKLLLLATAVEMAGWVAAGMLAGQALS